MNHSEIIDTIKQASLFDLYRLNIMINHEVENPERIQQVRNTFKEGDIVSYLDTSSNRLEQAKVLQKNPKYVLVENISDHKKWNIRYYSLNLKNIDLDLYNISSKGKLSKNDLRVGEVVGFNKDGTQIVGIILRLNYKTVTIITKDNHRWRVSYSYLFKIIDANLVNQFDPKQIAIWIQNENNNEKNGKDEKDEEGV
jgi:hypothetical protein